ncbi:calpastatin, isoform CRA_b [Rattus norvegicus]|uniref:Calpastatin, isoform CRA_b n=1 Tax=Rattus norvegicus TaxID=10116 RepID=A6I4E1_RAT|nr:calpastatin, isoform CRA_b [Rattus norvegicus]
MSTTGAKAVKIESEKSQSSEPPVIHEKKPKGKPKEGSEPQTLPKHASDTGSKHAHKEKALSRSNEQIVSEKSSESKTKFQDMQHKVYAFWYLNKNSSAGGW